jgi:hypothetical protein
MKSVAFFSISHACAENKYVVYPKPESERAIISTRGQKPYWPAVPISQLTVSE